MYALKELDTRRIQRISSVGDTHKAEFAQYLTPVEIASFMAQTTIRYFQPVDTVDVLDPGAGTGILSCSLVNELMKQGNPAINVDAFEIDRTIIGELEQSYKGLQRSGNISCQIYDKNFITDMGFELARGKGKHYDVIIMNPPYKKINTHTAYKNVLYDIGINTVNTYSAFIGIGIKMLKENGILTAIVPRSFCNGLYFLPFRKMVYENTVIKHLHIFESRKDNFKDENVLQENIIIVLQKRADKSGNVRELQNSESGETKFLMQYPTLDVTLKASCETNRVVQDAQVHISYSKEKNFTEYQEKTVSYDDVIDTDEKQYYISIPSYEQKTKHIPLRHTHKELGFDISTGPIVDFRMKEKLLFDTEGVPLLYSVHIRNQHITWPLASKKPNAIHLDDIEKEKLCFRRGYYILLKRFSSKEEKHRIQATLLTPDDLPTDYFTVENHLNIIHSNRCGLDRDLAIGLVQYLNSDYCDFVFRMFSGHTQVNATDLRNMKYPDIGSFSELG